MFDQPAVSLSTHHRASGPHLLAEVVATTGRLLLIYALDRSGQASRVPAAVAAYIGAGYWFTSSTSFANPAITLGRTLSDTFAGIAPASAPAFVVAQTVGVAAGYGLIHLLYPAPAPAGNALLGQHPEPAAAPSTAEGTGPDPARIPWAGRETRADMARPDKRTDGPQSAAAAARATVWSSSAVPPLTPTAPTTRPSRVSGTPPTGLAARPRPLTSPNRSSSAAWPRPAPPR
ncbi:hypothetical protein BL253_14760 [Pseudofrankia asymbiotica]|uniref:Major intrinsic protein n=1 Tax=Pseudofrankia asymbiotica TaxID=1834516 RepID=A0A1V2IAZ3_9ACTN|nr:hypothetical protein BL253_14760 [Pseudofrankia asymbiotica]